MAELPIHSMSEFADLILGALDLADARELVEIGAEHGGMSALLATQAEARGGRLTSIDPAPRPAFVDWAANNPQVRHLALPSLDAIALTAGVDAWIVDGDHNWYTVHRELAAIDAAGARDGKPLLVVLHDVGWPCGRRDMYYAPERIPPEFRHPHSYSAGVSLDRPDLIEGGGFRSLGEYALSLHEGGPRNGVLTAVEDFAAEQLATGRELGFAEVPGVFGLGVLFDLDAPWSAALAELLLPYHGNALLRSLERNRLANYLRVIELQDAGT